MNAIKSVKIQTYVGCQRSESALEFVFSLHGEAVVLIHAVH